MLTWRLQCMCIFHTLVSSPEHSTPVHLIVTFWIFTGTAAKTKHLTLLGSFKIIHIYNCGSKEADLKAKNVRQFLFLPERGPKACRIHTSAGGKHCTSTSLFVVVVVRSGTLYRWPFNSQTKPLQTDLQKTYLFSAQIQIRTFPPQQQPSLCSCNTVRVHSSVKYI